MLIINNALDIKAFKESLEDITWTRYERKLSENRKDIFIVGKLDKTDESLKVTIRPSNVMSVTEVYRRYSLDGRKVDDKYEGKTCDWGASVEVRIDDSLRQKIESICTERIASKQQVISWNEDE